MAGIIGQQLLDRIWCRIFHRVYHVERQVVGKWTFIECQKCKRTWPAFRPLNEEGKRDV